MQIKSMIQASQKSLSKNSPAILTGLAVAGVVSTTILASKASFKAQVILENDRLENEERVIESKYEQFKNDALLVWRLYVPTALTLTGTVAAILLVNKIGADRAAAIAAVATIADRKLKDLEDGIDKTVSEKVANDIHENVAQSQVDKNPINTRPVIVTGGGSVLCYDSITGRYFNSNIEDIRSAMNDVNELLFNEGYVSLSTFYDIIGLESTTFSDKVGWTTDEKLDIRFDTTLAEGKEPCIVINYRFEPVMGYDYYGN